MAKRNLGQVGFRDRGDYSDDATYKKWDMVSFEGSTYICSINEQDGLITGMNPFYYPLNWKCIAQGGIDGIDGLDGKDGLDGRDGRDGKDGLTGESGVIVLPDLAYSLTIREGDLIITYNDDEVPPRLHINEEGDLILTTE